MLFRSGTLRPDISEVPRTMRGKREAGEIPARSRHCDGCGAFERHRKCSGAIFRVSTGKANALRNTRRTRAMCLTRRAPGALSQETCLGAMDPAPRVTGAPDAGPSAPVRRSHSALGPFRLRREGRQIDALGLAHMGGGLRCPISARARPRGAVPRLGSGCAEWNPGRPGGGGRCPPTRCSVI